jgi:dienelactone hydrolase
VRPGLLFSLLLLLSLSGQIVPVAGADDLTVLPPLVDGVPPTGLLEEQLKKLAFAALDRRETGYEKIKTPADVAVWQQRQRASFLAALGGLPERTPLNARVTGQRDFGAYRMEKILFESQPGFLVSGLLYLPLGAGPHPAVLMPCGHTGIAKAGEAYQKASISLVHAGIAVFCFDPIGQGERRHFRQADGTPEFGSSTSEHQLMGISGTPVGLSLARVMIWDGIRGLDDLQSRQDIREDRLGCTGVSGGGTMTSYLMALDERIVAAAPACYLTGFRRLLATIGPQDFDQNHFGQITAGLDHADCVLLSAPRPVLIMAATQDYFDIQGAWNVFRESKRVYGRLGFPERVELVEADTKHDLAIEMREASTRWFRRWLAGRDDAWREPAFEILPEKEILCTPEGDVLRQPGARSFFDLIAAVASPLTAERQRFSQSSPRPASLAKVRELAIIRPLAELASFILTTEDTLQRGPLRIEKLTLRNAEGTVLPALLFHPAGASTGFRLYLHGDGKGAAAGPGGALEALARARFASEEWNQGRPVHLTGLGETGIPTLHAAALEPQLFASTRLERTLRTWTDVSSTPRTRNQQVNTVHGALRFYDLPDLAATLPAEKLVLLEPVDAAGEVESK